MPVAPTMAAVPISAYPDLAMRRPALVPQDLSCLQMAHAVNSMNHMLLCPPISTSVASMLTAPTTQRRWCLLADVCWTVKLFLFSLLYTDNVTKLLQLHFLLLWLFLLAASYSVKSKVDLHIQSGFVYYIDNSTYTSYKGIYRTKTSGGYTMRLISSGIGKLGIQGLAVDWIAGMMSTSFLLLLLLSIRNKPSVNNALLFS